ncbi:MAG TPA: hypothetical protein VHB97_00630 [Polyangia bacterium]|nr:hypothetical protein [Polyangia bacterium]
METRARLDEITHALRALHKALVELVRLDYEKRQGRPVGGPVQLFQLLTRDPFFLWLHPMSALMAEIDELYDQKEPIAADAVAAVRATLESLLGDRGQEPSPDSFISRYLEILQNHPEVVMAHARVRKALDRLY